MVRPSATASSSTTEGQMATRTFTASFSTNDVEAIQVVSMHLHQRMGKPSDAKVEVLFADAIDPDELVGGTCLISFAHEGEEPVALMGVAMSVSMVGSAGKEGAPTHYSIHVADQ